MKIAEITYLPTLIVEISTDEIAILSTLAGSHYDAECRATIIPGGSLYRMAAHARLGLFNHSLSFRDLDILAKVAQGTRLGSKISLELNRVSEETCEVNAIAEHYRHLCRRWKVVDKKREET